MSTEDERVARLTLVIVPMAIVIVGCCLSVLPRHVVVELVSFMFVWASVSAPVGVLVGHCMLNEGERL